MNRPSVDECVQGLERILDKMNPQQMMMLRAHYHSAGRAATMRELATAAGYTDYKMANLQYGNLAKRLYQAMGYPKPKSPGSGNEYWILGLGEFIARREFGLEMQCVMRPEIAGALERLGIVESSAVSEEALDVSSNVTVESDDTEIASHEPGEQTRTSETDPIRVDFLRSEEFPLLNRLGITFAPAVVELTEESGLQRLDVGTLAEGEVIVLRFQASADASVPESMSNVISIASKFEKELRHGASVIVHCKDNPEMAPLAAACIAVAATDAEISASEAIALVREAHPEAIETEAQEQFVAEFEKEWREVMARRGDHYLLYWQERSVQEHAANDMPLDVIASNQLFSVSRGDVIWIATMTHERELVLAGRMVVGEIVEYEEAIRRMPDAGLWQAEYYAFPELETEEYLREIDIQYLAEELRFDTENDRLILRDGKINPQQLQSMRKLTNESAEMLEEAFYTIFVDPDEQAPEVQVDIFRAHVEFDPEDATAHYNLGVALGRNGMHEEAIASFERTLYLDHGYFGAQYNIGNALVGLGRYEEAIEALNKAILIDGEFAPAHFMLGVAYFESGRFDDAIAATRQGLVVDPDDEAAYYNIAFWTFRYGDYRAALASCDDVIARFPFFTSPHVLKGMCFRELGELESEIQSYRDAVDIKVDDEGAFVINFTALFFLGAAWERKVTGSDEGIEYVEADNHFDLQDPTHQFFFAMGHLAQGDREHADQSIEGLRVSAPDLARRLERAVNFRN